MAILSKGCKPDKFESQSFLKLDFQIFEVFLQILLNVSSSLNQTLITFLLYVRQTWMALLFLVISL